MNNLTDEFIEVDEQGEDFEQQMQRARIVNDRKESNDELTSAMLMRDTNHTQNRKNLSSSMQGEIIPDYEQSANNRLLTAQLS